MPPCPSHDDHDAGTGGPRGTIVSWVPPEEEQRRRDLRGPEYFICSIDPIGCTDVDDALHARMVEVEVEEEEEEREGEEGDEEKKGVGAGGGGESSTEANHHHPPEKTTTNTTTTTTKKKKKSTKKTMKKKRLLEVGVHIADVSHFVVPGGALDGEGAARCTSYYLADRRLDMLPAVLSGNLCSLLSHVDRLAVSVIWLLDPEHAYEIKSVWFGRTIIRSRYKLHYQQAQDIHDLSETDLRSGDDDDDHLSRVLAAMQSNGVPGMDEVLAEDVPVLWTSIHYLADLTRHLRKRREEAGALTLASAEMRFELHGPTDAKGGFGGTMGSSDPQLDRVPKSVQVINNPRHDMTPKPNPNP